MIATALQESRDARTRVDRLGNDIVTRLRDRCRLIAAQTNNFEYTIAP